MDTSTPMPKNLNLNLLAAHLSIDAPHYKSSRFYNFPKNFERLFQTPVSHARHHPRHLSALSPAAYFVDLLRMLEKHLPDHQLTDRRPDIWELPLDREQSEEPVPFLEIVNNVMATHLSRNSAGEPATGSEEQKQRKHRQRARELLATAEYPLNMPFNYPLLEIRTFLAHSGVKLADVYETFQQVDQEAWVAELLGVSPLELEGLAILGSRFAQSWGLPGNSASEIVLKDVGIFLKQAGLTPDAMAELMRVRGLSLGRDKDSAGSSGRQHIENLPTIAELDHLNRFIRLGQRLGWSFTDLDWALRSVGPDAIINATNLNRLAQVKDFSEKLQLPVDVLCSFIHDMKTTPGFASAGKAAARSLFDRVFNTPPFYSPGAVAKGEYHPTGSGHFPGSGTEPLAWDSTGRDKQNRGIRGSLLAALGVQDDELEAIVGHLVTDFKGDSLQADRIKLDVPGLTRLYRFSKMARVLGMQVREYLVLLKCIAGSGEHRLKLPEISSLDDLRALDYWAGWLKETGLSAYELEYMSTGTLSDEAQRRLGPGPTVEQLASVSNGLKPSLVVPQVFARGTMSPETAADVCTALRERNWIDRNGLFCDIGPQAMVVQVMHKLTKCLVREGPEHRAPNLHARLPVFLPLQFLQGSEGVDSIIDQLMQKGLLTERGEFAIGVRFGIDSDLSFLLEDPHLRLDPDRQSKCDAVKSLLLHQAEEVDRTLEQGAAASAFDLGALRQALGGTGSPDGKALDQAVESVLGRLQQKGILDKAFSLFVDIRLDQHTDLSFLDSDEWGPPGPERASRLAEVQRLLVRKASEIREIVATLNQQLEHQAQLTSRLLAETFHQDPHLVASVLRHLDPEASSRPEGFCAASVVSGTELPKVVLLLHVAKALDLSAGVLDALRSNPPLLALDSSRPEVRVSLETLRSVHAFTQLVKRFEKHDVAGKEIASDLAALALRWPFTDQQQHARLCELSGWNESETHALRKHFEETPEMSGRDGGAVGMRGSSGLASMQRCFDLAAKVGVDIELLIKLCGLHAEQDTEAAFASYSATAQRLLWALKSKYSHDDWEKTFGPIRDYLNERERDALAALLLQDLRQKAELGPAWQNIRAGEITNFVLLPGSETVFVGTWGSGVFRLQTRGSDTEWLNDGLGSSARDKLIRSLVRASTRKGQTLFAAPSDKGIFRLDENGAQHGWQPCSDGLSGRDFNARQSDSNSDVWALVATADGGILFAGASQGRILRRAADAATGSPWQPLFHNAYAANAIADGKADRFTALQLTSDDKTLLAATAGHGVFRCDIGDESGTGWVPVGSEKPHVYPHCLAVAPDGSLFAGTYESGVFARKLGDGADVKWQELNIGLPSGSVRCLTVTGDGKTVLVATKGGGVFRRDVGAAPDTRWLPLDVGFLYGDVTALAVTSDSRTLFGGTEVGEVFRCNFVDGEWQRPGPRFDTLQDLSEYLLIDVEMSGCAKTSCVNEAIGCVQTYIERCRMHLEDVPIKAPNELNSQWGWMGHYRMWEANRKVFFYPENYLEPSQRKQATPLFKQLQDELLQGDITDEALTDAYINYFDRLDELASLEIIEGHVARVTNPLTDISEETLFIIGRTHSDPPIFFYRSAVYDRAQRRFSGWVAWQKIDLSIPARSVTALYALNRLYLFWAEVKTTTEHLEGERAKRVTTEATVMYTYQRVSGRWVHPQKYPVTAEQGAKLQISGVPTNSSGYLPPVCSLPVPHGRATASLLVRGDLTVKLAQSLKEFSDWSAKSGAPRDPDLSMYMDDWHPLEYLHAVQTVVTPDGHTLFAVSPSACVFRCAVARLANASWDVLTSTTNLPNASTIDITTIAISRSGRTLYAGTTTGGIFVRQVGDASDKPWDQRGPTPSITHVRTDVEMDIFSTTTRTWAWHSSSGVTCLALAPNGQTLFASTLEGGIFTAQVGSGSGANWLQITNVEGRHGAVTSMVVSPDGKFLVVGSAGGGVLRRSLDAALDAPWESLDTLANCSIDALAIAPDGATIYGISRKATSPVSWKDVQAFCISRITEANHNATFLYPSTTLAVAPDSQTVLLGTESFGLLIEKLVDRDDTRWDFQHRVVLPEPIRTLAVTPDGRTVFAGTTKGNIFRCNIGNRELSPDGRTFFASPGTDKTVFGVPSDAGGTMLVVRPGDDGGWVRQPLTTTAIHELRGKLVDGGLKSLLTLASQASVNFDGSDPYSIYFREIFFHIPFLIADALNGNQQFEHARKWYHYILDPTHEKSRRPGDDGGMWRCLFLRDHTMAKLLEELNDAAHHDELAEDPFDPHAIAQTRLGAYEKAVAMKYLDNLLDWGDVLFAQDSWEAINHAVLLYINALNLLGPRPAPASVSLPPTGPARTMTGGRSQLAIHRSTLAHEDLPQTEHSSYREPFDEVPEFLCLPENDEFARYWDRAQDCLFKVRHCMNRQGIVRQLALFEPPLDPRQLIRAMAAGQDIDSLGAQSMPTVPHYRFPVMLQQAKNLTATAMQLGSALLSALEKRDAEDLNLLRSAQEQQVLKMIREIKEQQIEDGARHLESLGHSLGAAQVRADHFSGLIATGYSDAETTSLALDTTAGALHVVAAELNGLSVVGHLVPTIYGAADGGMQPGHAVAAGAQLAGSAAAALQTAAGMAATIAQFQRRAQEWGLQQALAGCDVQQIQAEIAAAESRQTILQRDLETHDVSTEHARERDDFIRRKFGNSDLYQWMSGRLATVCFQTYKLAFDLARSAEKAYQYERHTDQTFLDFGYWDSLRKGLLAGEGLMLGLNQLEKAHLDGDARELEVEKTISLLQLAPMALLDLKAKGECTFDLTEQLFDYDFPGHYCRRIKSVSISIPAVVGPYQNIQATLTQVSDRMLIEANADAVKSLLPGGKLDPSKPNGVRSSWRPFQQIAISRGVDDSGLFQLDFRDERYLPFEGTGAISSWKLSLPKAANRNLDFASISDVIVHLRYTALDGGERFRDAVIEEIKAFAGVRMFSMRQEFSVAWQNRMNGKMNVRLVDEMFPMNFKAGTLKLGEITSLEVSKDTSPQRAAKQREGQLNGDFAIDGISPAIEDMLLVVPFSAELDYG